MESKEYTQVVFCRTEWVHVTVYIVVYQRLCPCQLRVCTAKEVATVHEHKEHHSETLWWQVQGYLPRNLRKVGIEEKFSKKNHSIIWFSYLTILFVGWFPYRETIYVPLAAGNMKRISKRPASGTNTDWLTTWSPKLWSPTEVLYGRVRTMMETSNLM